MKVWLAAGGRLVLLSLVACAAYSQSLFFSRSFPQSVPPYFEIEVASDGTVTYREEPEEEDPLTFELPDDERQRIFDLVRGAGPASAVPSDRANIAFTGDKALRLDAGGGPVWEAKFVHTEVPAVTQAVQWFSHVSETERHRIDLERDVVFDHLGVNKALLYFQRSIERGRVVGPKQFLPVLQKIADGKAYLHMDRSRAASLIEQIQSGTIPAASQ